MRPPAPRRAASPAGRSSALLRALRPMVLPAAVSALWQPCAQAQQVLAPEAADAGMAPSTAAPAAGGSLGAAVGPGLAAPVANARRFAFVPRLAMSETLTDNVRLDSRDRRADLITQLTVGAQLVSTGGRVRGFADYALTGLHYARGSAAGRLQNALAAAFTAEVLERRGYVDVSANISQQAASAFGTLSSDPALANANRTEVRTYRIAPYLRGPISNVAVYDARLTRAGTTTSTSSVGNVATTTVSLLLADAATGLGAGPVGVGTGGLGTSGIGGTGTGTGILGTVAGVSPGITAGGSSGTSLGTGGGRLGWSLDLSHQEVAYSVGRHYEFDRMAGTLLVTPLPELRLALIGGREANNYTGTEKTGRNVWGLRVNWTPGPRTAVVAETQRRFFGNSHVLTLSHRMPRSALLASDVRDVYISGTQGNGGIRATLFDLYDLVFRSIEPNPDLRRQLVNDFLLANNRDPSTLLPFNVLTSSLSVQRLQQLSYTWLGLRDTLTLLATRTNTERLEGQQFTGFLTGDFATYNRLRQSGVALTWQHRLTPLSSLSATVAQQRNVGDASPTVSVVPVTQDTRLRTALVTWSTRLNPSAGAALTARHSRSDGNSTSGYRESAVIATLNLQF